MQRIVSVQPDFTSRSLSITFDDGLSGDLDIKPLIAQGGVFSALDTAEEFNAVAIGDTGRFIEWPCGVDLCADALHQQIASKQHA